MPRRLSIALPAAPSGSAGPGSRVSPPSAPTLTRIRERYDREIFRFVLLDAIVERVRQRETCGSGARSFYIDTTNAARTKTAS